MVVKFIRFSTLVGCCERSVTQQLLYMDRLVSAKDFGGTTTTLLLLMAEVLLILVPSL